MTSIVATHHVLTTYDTSMWSIYDALGDGMVQNTVYGLGVDYGVTEYNKHKHCRMYVYWTEDKIIVNGVEKEDNYYDISVITHVPEGKTVKGLTHQVMEQDFEDIMNEWGRHLHAIPIRATNGKILDESSMLLITDQFVKGVPLHRFLDDLLGKNRFRGTFNVSISGDFV